MSSFQDHLIGNLPKMIQRFLFMDHGNSPKGNSPKCIQPSIEEDYQDLIVLKHGPVRFSLLQDWRVLSGPLM